ncbi:hypothetical protein D915_002928 [Fasciola hepatica]|uniref:ARID domain-containing protein n=1 Tax=Fasciola hepatica TaxID=6192 RepID=A0A4E0RX94_FASHE|nr:hypothetical protein D915_002928 [Fasciola hepatica]
MNRNKRVVSCPNLFPRCNKRLENEVNNSSALRKIENQYAKCAPRVLGRPVKLSDLFTAVVIRGGYRVVCEQRLWNDVARALCLPSACTNSSVGLRRIYYQYLNKYELSEFPSLSENYLTQNYVDFSSTEAIMSDLSRVPATSVERNLGIDQYLPGGELAHSSHHSFTELPDSLSRSARAGLPDITWPYSTSDKTALERPDPDSAIRQVPGGYTNLNDPARLRDLSELRLAELALESGLPNEIDVALNSLLALSVTPSITRGSTSIRLAQCSNLLSLILATVGIYDDSSGSFVICDPVWRKQTQLNFLKFWHNMVEDREGRLFLRPDVFINADFDPTDNSDEGSSFVELFAPSSISSIQTINPRITLSRVSCLNEDPETARSLLVATILVNLVTPSPACSGNRYEDDDDESEYDALVTRTLSPCAPSGLSAWRENARYIAANPTGLRFAFLAAHARLSGLKQLGLQLLSSLRYPLDPPPVPITLNCPFDWTPLVASGCRLGDLTLSFLARSILNSNDRASLIAGLNFLSNLAKVPDKANEASLLNGLPSVIWPRLAQLVCLPDLAVVCACLDALRCLTNLGHFACLFAWQACQEDDISEPSGLPLSLLQPLLALLTLEGQAMGSQSLHRIKLMQRNPPPMATHPSSQSRPIPVMNVRSHPPPSDWVAQTEHYRALSSMHSHGIPRSAPHRGYPQSKAERVPLIVSGPPPATPHTLLYNGSPVPRPPRVGRPHQLAHGMELPSASNPSGPAYRPPSGSTSCTGLINLLTSTTSSPPCTVPITTSGSTVAPSIVTATTSCTALVPSPSVLTPNTVPSVGCAKLPSTTTALSPSLSELTDRLQMPPPSLPPPSALRRSAKSAQPRSVSSIVNSPPATARLKPDSLPSPKIPPSTISSAPPIPLVESSAIENVVDIRCSSSPPASSQTPRVPTPQRLSSHTLAVEHIKQEATETMDNSHSSATSALVIPISAVNGISNHSSHSTGVPDKLIKLHEEPHESSKPLMNGDLKINPNGNLKEDRVTPSKSNRSNVALFFPVANGLKPGLLQAAMKALEDQNRGERIGSLESKRPESEPILMNGNMEPLCPSPVMSGKNKLTESESPSNSQSQTLLNGIQKPVLDGSDVNTCSMETVPISDVDIKSRAHGTTSHAEATIVNGELEGNSDCCSRSSGANKDPETRTHNSDPTRYWLKRRRRWGSRSRLLTPKRRREHVPSSATTISNFCSPSRTAITTSPLKPLPFQSDPLPDSVLGPSWKPVWSVELNVPASPIPGNKSQSDGDCTSVQDFSEGDKKDANLVTSPQLGDQENGLSGTSGTATAVPISTLPSYMCEWESCSASFEDKSQVSSHVYLMHLVTKSTDSISNQSAYVHPALPVRRCCRWRGCSSSSLARAPFALLTHVLDVHCSPIELDAALYHSYSRDQPKSTSISTPSATGSNPSSCSSISGLQNLCSTMPADLSPSPSGDPSAWSIVRSLEAKQIQLDLWAAQHHFISANPFSRIPLPILGPNPQPPMIAPPPREGPVTKHLRVSAALVIRNLVTYIEEARSWLLSELPLLSEIVMGCSPSDGSLRTNDACRIIAQCLSICYQTRKNSTSVGPFLPAKSLPDNYIPRDLLLPSFRTPHSHPRHRRHHGPSSSLVHRHPVLNVDLDARGS